MKDVDHVSMNIDFPYFAGNVVLPELGDGFELDKFHYDMANLLYNNKFVYIISPRGHLKTTLFSIAYPIWIMYRQQRKRISLISASLQQSWSNMEIIQNVIESSPHLKHLIPSSRRDTWNRGQINTTTRCTCFVRPFRPSIRGTHVHYSICDDILRDEEITQEQAIEYFWSLIFPITRTLKGQHVVIGTPMTTDDLFAQLENPAKKNPQNIDIAKILGKAGMLPIGNRWQAVVTNKKGKWLRPLWEKQFTLDQHEATRYLQGSLIFDREYMCNPRAGGSAIFTENLLSKRHSLELNIRRKGCLYFLGVDVAISEKQTSDFTVFMVIEMDAYRNLRVVKMERYQGKSTDWQIRRIKELHRDFNFATIEIEDRGLSKGMVRTLQEDEETRYVTDPFVTGKINKELLVSGIESSLSTGELTLLDTEVLINELKNFGIKKDRSGKQTYEALGGHDDTVIALGLAIHAIRKRGVGVASIDFV